MFKVNRKCMLTFNSLAISIIISAQYFSYIANIYLKITSGVVTIIALLAIVIEIAILLYTKKTRLKKVIFAVTIYILIYLLISICFFNNKDAFEYTKEFLCYGFFAILALSNEYDDEKILFFLMSYSIFFIISPSRYINGGLLNLSYARIDMFTSYALLPTIVAFIFHSILVEQKKKIHYLLYLINLLEFICAFQIIGRGPLLVIVVALMVAINIKMIQNGPKWSFKRKMVIISAVLLGSIVMINFSNLVNFLDTFLGNRGISIAALHKIVVLQANNNVLNYRYDNWNNALSIIKEYPLFGGGVAVFSKKFGVWPHNIFLQLWDEMGIIGSLPLLLLVLKGCANVIGFRKNEEFKSSGKIPYLMLLTFSLAMTRLMVSSYYWHLPEFWLFFYGSIVLNNRRYVR